jgi:hypothetical protein
MVLRPPVAALILLGWAAAVEARVDRIEVLVRGDVLAGKPFGLAGAYEKIIARAYYKVRPENAHNQRIVDLDKAERNAAGEVEFWSDLYILKPKSPARGNGALLLEIPNRGGKGMLRVVNGGTGQVDPSAEADFGDGFLLRKGFTLAWVGWQFDVRDDPGVMRLGVPIAKDAAGPIRGLVRADFVVASRTADHPLGHQIIGQLGGKGYPAANPSEEQASLTVRDSAAAPREKIPRPKWRFAREVDGKVTPDPQFVHLDAGFEPGRIYEVVYTAENPPVVGLGLAAVRDLVSHLKYDTTIAPVRRAYSIGISQSGRFLRHFLYEDFNADEQGRRVLDGIIAHVAGAGRGSFNHRFAQPSRDAQPNSSVFYPTDIFPFADSSAKNPYTKEPGGLLEPAKTSATIPKLFFTNTSYEYWSRAASLIHTTPDGKLDLQPNENVRIYFLSGLQHFSGPFPPAYDNRPELKGQQKSNPNPIIWFWRALIADLDEWVNAGKPPPASVFPKLADGTLVPIGKLQFPKIPAVETPSTANLGYQLDFGPRFYAPAPGSVPPRAAQGPRSSAPAGAARPGSSATLGGFGVISVEPPRVVGTFPVLVPQVDADGNDRGGIRLPELLVPLATYTGWNLRDPKIGAPKERVSFIGSYIPFAKTRAERDGAGDPRLSIAERYQGRDQYLGLYAQAAIQLIGDRFLLPEDLSAAIQRAGREWDEVMGEKVAQ